MNGEVVAIDANSHIARAPHQIDISEEDIEVLKNTYALGLTNAELKLFIAVAKEKGLSPMARQIHAVKRGGKMAIQTSIDGFRLIAQRSGAYAGQGGPWWCGKDGVWLEFWPKSNGAPVAAKVEVMRHGFVKPMTAIATWDEYSQGDGPMWKKMPALMLGKCAEALALRKAFPEDLSGVYTDDEMDQAGSPIEIAPPEPTEDVSDLIAMLSEDQKTELKAWWKANLPGGTKPEAVPESRLADVYQAINDIEEIAEPEFDKTDTEEERQAGEDQMVLEHEFDREEREP